MDLEHDATFKGFVHVLFEIGGEDGDPFVSFDELEEDVDVHVGVAVVGVLDLGAFGEDAVGFVKEEDAGVGARALEDAVEVFFGFADVFVNDGGDVDAQETKAQGRCDDLGGEGFAGARFAIEEAGDAESAANATGQLPIAQDAVALHDGVADGVDLSAGVLIEDEIVETYRGMGQHSEGSGFERDLHLRGFFGAEFSALLILVQGMGPKLVQVGGFAGLEGGEAPAFGDLFNLGGEGVEAKGGAPYVFGKLGAAMSAKGMAQQEASLEGGVDGGAVFLEENEEGAPVLQGCGDRESQRAVGFDEGARLSEEDEFTVELGFASKPGDDFSRMLEGGASEQPSFESDDAAF